MKRSNTHLNESSEDDTNKDDVYSLSPEILCPYCTTTFTRKDNLKRHCEKFHHPQEKTKSTCDQCQKSFTSKTYLRRHKQRMHKEYKQITFQCRHCEQAFEHYKDLVEHVEQNHPLNQTGGRDISQRDLIRTSPTSNNTINKDNNKNQTVENNVIIDNDSALGESAQNETSNDRALNNAVQNHYIYPKMNEKYDLLVFLANVKDQLQTYLLERTIASRGIKWNLCIQVLMQRDDEEDNTSSPYFRSHTYSLLNENTYDESNLNEAMQKIHASMEKYLREGSGWFVKQVIKLEIHTVNYSPISGSTYIPLPQTFVRSRSILNIMNQNNKCFLYCILASLHPSARTPEKVHHYIPYEHEVNMNGIEYPMTLKQLNTFEHQNSNISVNVFTLENKDIVPLRITQHSERLQHVNLLLLQNGNTSHYCLITDLDRFLSRTKTHQNRLFFCPYCLHGFRRAELRKEHISYCKINGPQKVELPEDNILQFNAFEKLLKTSFTIYSDFESLNKPITSCSPNSDRAHMLKTHKLDVCGFGYKVVCEDPAYTKPTVIYRGSDASEKLIEALLEERSLINDILSHPKPMVMTDEDKIQAEHATTCGICNKQFSLYDDIYQKRVRHHNHFTGAFICMAHNSCNLKCTAPKHIPVVFHGLKNFDSHIIASSMGLWKDQKISCIAQTMEKYVSFGIANLRFIDSYQFLPSSLATLTSNLVQNGLEAMSHLQSEFDSNEKAQLMMRKQVYPYEYFTDFDCFDETCLPPIEKFYSSLTRETISKEDYDHVHKVYDIFQLDSLGALHDLYLKSDVVLLAEVFESFRSMCMNQYGLDPCHFVTSPGLAWTALLKMTNVSLELLTDIDQILFIERGIRGGISQISHRYAQANNPKVDNYNSSLPSSYLMYLDMNNLYGWAMCQPLPVDSFKWMSEAEMLRFDIHSVPVDNDYGYILEVTLRYPATLHDYHNDYPLAPERRVITDEELSPYAKHLWRKLNRYTPEDAVPSRGKTEKLILSFDNKEKYILHYRNLQLYLELGMEIVSIHRVLTFRQAPWMKTYIDYNTQKRKEATTTFEKNFYKLMNVSVFGKTMENVRKHRNIELVHTETRLNKLSSKPSYKTTKIFSEDLVAVELNKVKVKLNKPSYSGMCILDLSKIIMYEFFYKYLKPRYGNKLQLLMTDTDSFLFHCHTDDIYQDFMQDEHLFDFSDYPKNHPMHSEQNKKVLGKMKDETNGQAISEFVGLRSKMYAFKCNDDESKRAKGISRITVEKDLSFNQYKQTLDNESKELSSMTAIRSHDHQLYCERITKIGLSAFDDKRFLLDAKNSLAYGHYKIAEVFCGVQVQAVI